MLNPKLDPRAAANCAEDIPKNGSTKGKLWRNISLITREQPDLVPELTHTNRHTHKDTCAHAHTTAQHHPHRHRNQLTIIIIIAR